MRVLEQRDQSQESLKDATLKSSNSRANLQEENPLNALPDTKLFTGTVGNVLQGQGCFIEPPFKRDALYSGLAWSCSLVLTISRDPSGTINRIGLAHIDPQMKEDQIRKFFTLVKTQGSLEISIISGAPSSALTIRDIASSFGEIKLFSPDLGKKRYDSALIDKTGKIYYGAIEELNDMKAAHKRNNDRRLVGELETVNILELQSHTAKGD